MIALLLVLVGAIAAGWCPSAAGQTLGGYRQEALLDASPVFGGRRVQWTRAGTQLMAVVRALGEHPSGRLDIWELHVEGARVATWCYRLTPEELGVSDFAWFQVVGSALFLRDKDRIVSYDLALRRVRGEMRVPRHAAIECLAPDQLVEVDSHTGTHRLLAWRADAVPELGPPIAPGEPLTTPHWGTRGYSRDRLFGYLLDRMGRWVARVELGGQRVVRLPGFARQIEERDRGHSLQLVSGRDVLCFIRCDPWRVMLWDLRADELWRSVPLPEAVVDTFRTVCLTDDSTALVFAGRKDLWRCDLASQQWDRTARRANGWWEMRAEAVPGAPFVALVPTTVGRPFELIDARRLQIVLDSPGCHVGPIVDMQLAKDVLAASSETMITTYNVAEQQRVGWIEHQAGDLFMMGRLSPYWGLGPAGDMLHVTFKNDLEEHGSFGLTPGPTGWRIATLPATLHGRVTEAPALAPFNGWVLAPAHKPGELWCRIRVDEHRIAVERRRLADGEVLGRVTLGEFEGAHAVDSDEGILITSSDVGTSAYRLADGQRLWEKPMGFMDAQVAGGRVAIRDVDAQRAVVLDAHTGKELWSEQAPDDDFFRSVRLAGNGRLLLLLTRDTKQVRLIELPGGKVLAHAVCADIAPTAIAISYDGQRIALADQDRRIFVFRRVD